MRSQQSVSAADSLQWLNAGWQVVQGLRPPLKIPLIMTHLVISRGGKSASTVFVVSCVSSGVLFFWFVCCFFFFEETFIWLECFGVLVPCCRHPAERRCLLVLRCLITRTSVLSARCPRWIWQAAVAGRQPGRGIWPRRSLCFIPKSLCLCKNSGEPSTPR